MKPVETITHQEVARHSKNTPLMYLATGVCLLFIIYCGIEIALILQNMDNLDTNSNDIIFGIIILSLFLGVFIFGLKICLNIMISSVSLAYNYLDYRYLAPFNFKIGTFHVAIEDVILELSTATSVRNQEKLQDILILIIAKGKFQFPYKTRTSIVPLHNYWLQRQRS